MASPILLSSLTPAGTVASTGSPQSFQVQQDTLTRSITKLIDPADELTSLPVFQAKLAAFNQARELAFEPASRIDFQAAQADLLARVQAIQALLAGGLGAIPMTSAQPVDLPVLATQCSAQSQAKFALRQRSKEAARSIQSILKQR